MYILYHIDSIYFLVSLNDFFFIFPQVLSCIKTIWQSPSWISDTLKNLHFVKDHQRHIPAKFMFSNVSLVSDWNNWKYFPR